MCTNGLNCFFVNARSLLNNFKLEELHNYAIEHNLQIIGIAETWLNSHVGDGEISINDFTMYRKDRSCVKLGKGGGVLLYIHNSLFSSACTELNNFKSESIWCNVWLDKTTEIVIGVCYKSPNADVNEIDELFQSIKESVKKQVIIVGNFNYPGINWSLLDSDYHGRNF